MSLSVILTRPAHRNAGLAQRVSRQGHAVINLPALTLEPTPLEAASFPLPGGYDVLVFVSSFAAQVYVDQLQRLDPHPVWPTNTLAVTVGMASAIPLYDAGFIPKANIVHPAQDSPRQDSEALWERLQELGVQARRVLVLGGQSGRQWLTDQFQQSGATVSRKTLYTRQPAVWTQAQQEAVSRALHDPKSVVMLLTSAQSVDALHAEMRRFDLLQAWAACTFIVFHERITRRLQSILRLSGLQMQQPVIECAATDDAVCQTLQSLCSLHDSF